MAAVIDSYPASVFSNSNPLSDIDILLAHSIHFTWGYPDYIRQAFLILQSLHCEYVPQDSNRELTWGQLRKALETADSKNVRCLVACNPMTSQNVLDFLAKTGDPDVCLRVAENPTTHAATLTRLSRHTSSAVRMAVCENSNTAEGVLLYLAADVCPDVRFTMAENPNIPQTVLQVLSTDENPYVCERASRTLNRMHKGEIVVADFSRVARRRIDRAAL
jgi:hypothetical protein